MTTKGSPLSVWEIVVIRLALLVALVMALVGGLRDDWRIWGVAGALGVGTNVHVGWRLAQGVGR